MKQCLLERWDHGDTYGCYGHLINNVHYQTSWLPDKYAVLGKILDLKTRGAWSEGWRVIEVYHETKLDDDWVRERSQDYKDFAVRIK